jgi:hypothetical protein
VPLIGLTDRLTYGAVDNEEGWAAQRYMVWKEDWQQHCFALTTDATEEVASITVFLLSTHQPDSSDTVQLWVEQADLFPSRGTQMPGSGRPTVGSDTSSDILATLDAPATVAENCLRLAAEPRLRPTEQYQLRASTCTAEYAATASDVTLVTHLSLDQLSLLSNLASYWKGMHLLATTHAAH